MKIHGLIGYCLAIYRTRTSSIIYKNYIEMSEVAHSGQLLLTATEKKV